LLLEAEDCFKIVGLTGVGAEPPIPEPEADFLALCWCSEHKYVGVARLLATLDADQRRQIFELFRGFQNEELRTFCGQLLSLPPEEYDEVSIGAVIDRSWFDLASADVTSRAAAESARLEEIKIQQAREQERIHGRPEEVRDPAMLVKRFGTKVPLGYLAHATEYPRPDLGSEIVEALLLSWGTQRGYMPSGLWRRLHTDGDLAFLAWILEGRENVTLADLGRRSNRKTSAFFRKLNRLIARRTSSTPSSSDAYGYIATAMHEYYLKLKEAVPKSYR
jgi:hypothetical protein